MDAQTPKRDLEFLTAWRNLEQALNEEGPITALELEKNLSDQSRPDDADKLRICRQIRNFLTHNGHGMIAATPAMTKFVEDMIYEIRHANGVVKDIMTSTQKYGAVTPDTTISDAASLILSKKRQDVLIIDDDKKFLGIFGPAAMAAALAQKPRNPKVAWTMSMHCLKPEKLTIISDTTPVQQAPENKAVILDSRHRCIGVLNPEKGWTP